MLDHAFDTAGPHGGMLGVFEFNAGAIRACGKAGFKEKIGRRRQSPFAGGRMWDGIWMDRPSSEFGGSGTGRTA